MIRELRYQGLIKIAMQQLSSIESSINQQSENEKKKMESEWVIPHTFYRIKNRKENSLEFAIGLQHFLLKINITTSPNNEQFSMVTYEIVENEKNYGRFELKHIADLDFKGGYDIAEFTKDGKKWYVERELIGDQYLSRLLTEIDIMGR
jgi:hypothetical protein